MKQDEAKELKYKKSQIKSKIRGYEKILDTNPMEPDYTITWNAKEEAEQDLDKLKWADRMSPEEIEEKVME